MTVARQSYETANGVNISVLEKGSGIPLVFVHGSVTTSELFHDAVEYFGNQYHAIAVDLRGYGNSSKPGEGYNISQFSEDLANLFKAMEIDRPVLLGVSMGGFVAQDFVIRNSGALRGLVLASTSDGELAPGLFDSDPVRQIDEKGWEAVAYGMITGAFAGDQHEGDKQVLFDRISTLGDDVLREICQTIMDFDVSRDVPTINVPTLIMVGTEDHQLPVYLSERLKSKISGSRLEVFDGAGHFMMLEQPDKFRDSLEQFLELNFQPHEV